MSLTAFDILKLLGDETNWETREQTLRILSTLDLNELLNGDFAAAILLLLQRRFENSDVEQERKMVLGVLVNAVPSSAAAQAFLTKENDFVHHLWTNVFVDGNELAGFRWLAGGFLSNLSLTKESCSKLLEMISTKHGGGTIEVLRKLCNVILGRDRIDSSSSGKRLEKDQVDRIHSAGSILRNFSQLAEVRKQLAVESLDAKDGSASMLASILPILMRQDDRGSIKESISGIAKNISLDSELHEPLIKTSNDDTLSALLYPLIGGEQLADDENDALPIDLQYMDDKKTREPDLAIRLKLLETLYQLCATGEIREYLRKKGSYYVLREYHKWEQKNVASGDVNASKADVLCANVIGVLIRTEEEIGCDNLLQLASRE